MAADKEHLHHRLLSLEFSSVQTLMIFYSLSIVLMAISILSFQKQFIWGAILCFFLLLYLFFFLTLKFSHIFDMGTKKIRVINEKKLRETVLNISKHHQKQNTKTRRIDLLIAISSFSMLTKFIWYEATASFQELFIAVIFVITFF